MDEHTVYLQIIVILVSLSRSIALTDEVPHLATVSRRLSSDIFAYYNSASFRICGGYNTTILVSDRRCITNEELFNDCSFAITARQEASVYRLLMIAHQSHNSTVPITALTVGSEYTLMLTDAVVVHKDQQMNADTSFCNISSLEVYRGREQVIEISHQGFSLTENGTIEIYPAILAYHFEEYIGELYRMNLSCSGGRHSESGCLFFKVAGWSNITNAKFNCTVPGTLTNFTEECNTVTTDTVPTPITSALLLSTSKFNVELEPSNVIIPIIISSVLMGGVVTLTISITIVCIAIRFQNRRERQLQTGSSVTVQPQNEDAATTSQPSICQKNPAYMCIHLATVKSSQATGTHSQNTAHSIDSQPSSHQDPTYDVINTDGSPQAVPETCNIKCNQTPIYQNWSLHADTTSFSNCNQNPAYGVHSNHN